MASQQCYAADPVKYNADRIDRLIIEVGRLVALLERQRIVSPTDLIDLKNELSEMETGIYNQNELSEMETGIYNQNDLSEMETGIYDRETVFAPVK